MIAYPVLPCSQLCKTSKRLKNICIFSVPAGLWLSLYSSTNPFFRKSRLILGSPDSKQTHEMWFCKSNQPHLVLIWNAKLISTDASQSRCSGRSYRIWKHLLCHSQRDTHNNSVQSGEKEARQNNSPWINCLLCDFTSWLIGERGDESPFLMSSCRTAASPAYVVADMLIMSADKIPPDHSHVTVRTLRLPDMIRETNQICLQSEHSLKNSKLADNWN